MEFILKTKIVWGFFAVFFASVTVAEDKSKIGPFFKISSFSHSEPLAVYGLFNDWEGSLSTGRKAFSVNRFEAGFRLNSWQLSVLNRQDFYYEFAPKTAKLFYDTNNKKNLEAGETYNLQLSTNSFFARGLKLAYEKQFSDLKVCLAASYLEGYDVMQGDLSGSAQAVAENDYNFNFAVDYYYAEDALFSRKITDNVKGQGYAFDLNIDWQINPNWTMVLRAEDLLARIYWFDAPRTIADGSSQTKEFDEDGFVVFSPVANGLETNQSFMQNIPTKVFLSTEYSFNEAHSILVKVDDYKIKRFASLGYAFKSESNTELKVLANLTAEAMELNYQNSWLKASLISDSWDYKRAKTLGLGISVRYFF